LPFDATASFFRSLQMNTSMIFKLRKKLAVASNGKNYIETIWGQGYALRDAVSEEA